MSMQYDPTFAAPITDVEQLALILFNQYAKKHTLEPGEAYGKYAEFVEIIAHKKFADYELSPQQSILERFNWYSLKEQKA